MRLAVMLATAADETSGVAASLCRASVAGGHRARLFLLGDGTMQVDLGAELAGAGVEVSLCEADAAMRGIHKSGQAGVFFGSLYDWAALVEDADLVVSLA